MNKTDLKVINGGLLDSAKTSKKVFVSSYITNTRLMGVIGMYIHWSLPENESLSDLHQFFYFDAEEYGFETYESVLGSYPDQIAEIENSLMGGLGGDKIPICLNEAQYLLQEYVAWNNQEKIPLPDGLDEYDFLLEKMDPLSESELSALLTKQCTKLDSHYEVINYFLMRCFAKDFKAAASLGHPSLNLELFSDFKSCTFCKNTIDMGKEKDSYINESLIEQNEGYYLAITSITIEDLHIKKYERISTFKISPAEASMLLSRSEFVSIYELLCEPDTFSTTTTKLAASAMVTTHDTGYLYMIFHPNNKHVDKKEYRLNEDVLGMYYVTHSGQLISAAYALEDIHALETDLGRSPFGGKLVPISKYEFQEPVAYEFIQSGFDNFQLFVEAIKTEEE